MRAFLALYGSLDATTSTNEKVEAMQSYFSNVPPEDAAWALYFLSGKRIKRLAKRSDLKHWLVEASGYSQWMIDECYESVGDFAETAVLLTSHCTVPDPKAVEIKLSNWVEQKLLPLNDLAPDQKSETIKGWWNGLPLNMSFIATKLLTGGLRVGVSRLLLARALSNSTGLSKSIILHRMMGHVSPSKDMFTALVDPDTSFSQVSQPYPFFLASPIEKNVGDLGLRNKWIAEWKWDGIRAQAIRRKGKTFIWSRGEELVTERFPEVDRACSHLPDGTVLDGELIGWKKNVLSFSSLQRRLNRKNVSKKLLEEVPVRLVCYDCIEYNSHDIRNRPLSERKQILSKIIQRANQTNLTASPIIEATSWEELKLRRTESRARRVEGLMLKEINSVYETGRKRGHWWKWKVDPYTIDAVIVYAKAGSGRRANLFTDYTFAVWSDDNLVPIAKAYTGLNAKEIHNLDRWIRENTIERFGPVRSVPPKHVFEIGFEGITESKRHKSGFALRFPRILRWRKDKGPIEADRLEELRRLFFPIS